MTKKWIVAAFAVAALIVICICLLLNEKAFGEKELTEIQKLESLSGMTQSVGMEEYEFYKELARKEAKNYQEDENNAVLPYIEEVYAQFLIGVKLELCNPYSFPALKRDMENENQSRKIKLEKKEVFYGPEKFNLESYFGYTLNNLKNDIIQKLSDTADKKLEKDAENYLKNNPEKFSVLESVTYRTTYNGNTEEKVVKKQEMSILEKTNSDLFQKLYEGAEGDKFLYRENDGQAEGEILRKEVSMATLEERRDEIIKRYIAEEIYLKLVKKVGAQNPIEAEE